ncbi:MAG: hypothetical protein ACOC28_03760 [Alkalispirochaetaceae bacterium]
MHIRALLLSALFFALLGCAGTPEAAPRSDEAAPEGEEAAEDRDARALEEARQEASRYRREIEELRQRLSLLETEPAETDERPETEQLRIENQRLRELVEELRLALEATPPRQGEEEVGGFEEYREVESLAVEEAEGTPPRLALQHVVRIPVSGTGFRYLDRRVAASEASTLYLDILVSERGGQPEATLRARAVYPLDREPLQVEELLLGSAGRQFRFVAETVARERTALVAAETVTLPLESEQTRDFLRFMEHRTGERVEVAFRGRGGTVSHRLTPEERRALANMLYTYRELGGTVERRLP